MSRANIRKGLPYICVNIDLLSEMFISISVF